ncbi:hypothetical protein WBP07_13245 [Novosphingobium sp. BL-8A]|uniref:hypothetical protein n=1 Tax=Novosphingobium sp. BL-8A TaxID=3127639 RepID=UPI00375691B8
MPQPPRPSDIPAPHPDPGTRTIERQAPPDGIPVAVRNVLLLGFAASIVTLGLLGIFRAIQNPSRLPHSVETGPPPGDGLAGRKPAAG